MDPLVGLLDGPRARGAFVLRSIQDPPWSVQVRDEAPLSLVAIVRGDPWVVPGRGDAVRLRPGDVAIRTWGNSGDGSSMMLIGKYQGRGEISQRLLRALPPLLVLAKDAQDQARGHVITGDGGRGRGASERG